MSAHPRIYRGRRAHFLLWFFFSFAVKVFFHIWHAFVLRSIAEKPCMNDASFQDEDAWLVTSVPKITPGHPPEPEICHVKALFNLMLSHALLLYSLLQGTTESDPACKE